MDKIIVTIAGILGAVFIYWFFLMKSGRQSSNETEKKHHG